MKPDFLWLCLVVGFFWAYCIVSSESTFMHLGHYLTFCPVWEAGFANIEELLLRLSSGGTNLDVFP